MSTPLPSLLLNAARSAAVADGLTPPSPAESPNGEKEQKGSIDQDEQGKKEEAAAGLTMVANAAGKSSSPLGGKDGLNGSAQHAYELAKSALLNKNNFVKNNGTNGNGNKNFYRPNSAGSATLPSSNKAMHPPRSMNLTPQTQSTPPPPNVSKPGSSSGSKSKGPPLRRGKWTTEEENYANRLIQEFKAGLLPLTDGTTLRTFLSKLLNCDPMRISKKFVGSNCIGKQVFRRRTADINRLTPEHIEQSRKELSE